jgi:hypothetical protein
MCLSISVWGRRRRHSHTHRCTWAKPLSHNLLHTQGGYSEEEGEGTRLMTPIHEPAQVKTYLGCNLSAILPLSTFTKCEACPIYKV